MSTQVIDEPVAGQVAAAFEEIHSEFLELQIQRRLRGRVRDLCVLVRQDGVILRGWATTYHAKQLAQHAAMELGEAPIVANDIEVR